jgi:uncharacterized protein (DUF362 family)
MVSVSIVRRQNNDTEEAVRTAVKMAGGLSSIITPHSQVLVKPNLVTPIESGTGVITDCHVTEAVLRLALECGPERVVIGEGSGYGYDAIGARADTWDAFRRSGTQEVAERLGIECVDLNRDTSVSVEVPNYYVMDRVLIAKTVVESDVIISVPVLKTHRRTIVTLSLKNMKGVMPGREKRKTHQLGLERAIVDLNHVVNPHFTIVDGLVGLGGLWEGEDAAHMNLILAGQDPVAVDAVGARVMGFDPTRILMLDLAAEKGLGVIDSDAITINGEHIVSVAKRFIDPQTVFAKRYPGVVLIDEKACSACEGELQSPLFYIREAGCAENLNGLTIVMGIQDQEPPRAEKLLVMGRCARPHQDRGTFIPGCPPRGWGLTDAICATCNIDRRQVIAAIELIHGDLDEIR